VGGVLPWKYHAHNECGSRWNMNIWNRAVLIVEIILSCDPQYFVGAYLVPDIGNKDPVPSS